MTKATSIILMMFILTSCATSYYQNARLGNTEKVQAFLEKNPSIPVDALEYTGETALFISVKKQHIETVAFLISKGADVNFELPNSMTPLRQAISNGDVKMIKLLLDSGADVNKSNKYGWTPLMTAVGTGFT